MYYYSLLMYKHLKGSDSKFIKYTILEFHIFVVSKNHLQYNDMCYNCVYISIYIKVVGQRDPPHDIDVNVNSKLYSRIIYNVLYFKNSIRNYVTSQILTSLRQGTEGGRRKFLRPFDTRVYLLQRRFDVSRRSALFICPHMLRWSNHMPGVRGQGLLLVILLVVGVMLSVTSCDMPSALKQCRLFGGYCPLLMQPNDGCQGEARSVKTYVM